MSNLYRAPSIYASYLVSMHLVKQFRRKSFFLNRLIRNKNCLWQPCLLMDRNEMRNIYRGPSIVASYQVSVHLDKRFQRGIFKKIDQSEKELPLADMFVNASRNDQSLQRTFHRFFLPCFVYLAKWLQRRRSLEIEQSETRIAFDGHVCY